MTASYLMCPPKYFNVSYEINPWMDKSDKVDNDLVDYQWDQLYNYIINAGYGVELLNPIQHLPDLVFTANAGLVYKDYVFLSNFSHIERAPEQWFNGCWFSIREKFSIYTLDYDFEGAGDALFDTDNNLWLAHGFRTSKKGLKSLRSMFDDEKEEFNFNDIFLKLIDPRFYHLDTCFCPLLDGYIMYYPGAFSKKSLEKIETMVSSYKRIIVSEEDALKFSCNAIVLDNREVLMSHCSFELRLKLMKSGYSPIVFDMSEFIKSGGSCKCLTLRIK